VQSGTGGIQHQRGHILHDGKLNLIDRTVFRQGLQAVFLSQPGRHRLFHDGLAGGDGVEGGIQAVSLDGEGPIQGDKLLPGQGPGPLEEGVEVPGQKAAQLDEHPLAGAQIQVEPGHISGRTQRRHPAVVRPDLLQTQPAQLVRRQPL
jgi:hypothetical protein